MKTCTTCLKTKRDNGFFKRGDRPTDLRSQCKECHRNGRKQYYSTSEYKRFKRYGLTDEAYRRMITDQSNCCKICSRQTKLVVDHCHNTNKIRGLLCANCNRLLGDAYDSIEILKQAIEYLEVV